MRERRGEGIGEPWRGGSARPRSPVSAGMLVSLSQAREAHQDLTACAFPRRCRSGYHESPLGRGLALLHGNSSMSWIRSEDGPQIRLGPESYLPFERGLSREWLLTNGLGGFASSTVVGANSRRYHGPLVAAARPPVRRVVSGAKLEEPVRAPIVARARRSGEFEDDASFDEAIEFELSANQYPETVHPQGFLRLESFTLGRRARMQYRVRDLWIEKSVFLVPGANTTVVAYAHIDGPDCELTLRPLIVHRDYHALSRESSALNPHPEVVPGLVALRPYLGLPAIRMACSHGTFLPWPVWYKAMEYQVAG